MYISHVIQLTPQEQSAEPKDSASAEALTVARRPKEASREKTRAAAGIRRFLYFKGDFFVEWVNLEQLRQINDHAQVDKLQKHEEER